MDADLAVNEADSEEEEDLEEDEVMPNDLKKVKRYLLTLERPDRMTDKQFDLFRQFVLRFLVQEGFLFRCLKVDMPPKRAIWEKDQQVEIMQSLHEESGHRGKKGMYEKIALMYWWKGLY